MYEDALRSHGLTRITLNKVLGNPAIVLCTCVAVVNIFGNYTGRHNKIGITLWRTFRSGGFTEAD